MSGLRDVQERLTGWLRDPGAVAAPDDVAPERLAVYRELLLNNVRGFLENGFPALRAMVAEDIWNGWIEAFFARHRAASPYFRDIPGEFYQWLQGVDPGDCPWLHELAHFEWAGMLADVAEGDWPHAVPGDAREYSPVLSPFVWPLVYHWPVHAFPAASPERADVPLALLMYRTRDHQVMTLSVPLLVALLVEHWQHEPIPLSVVLPAMASLHGIPLTDLEMQIQPWLEEIRDNGILLGVRR